MRTWKDDCPLTFLCTSIWCAHFRVVLPSRSYNTAKTLDTTPILGPDIKIWVTALDSGFKTLGTSEFTEKKKKRKVCGFKSVKLLQLWHQGWELGGRTDKYTAPAGWKTKQRGLKKDSKTDEVGDEDYRIATQVSWETVWGYSKDGREVALTFRWGLTSPRAPIWHSSACKTWGKKKQERRQGKVWEKATRGV